MSRRSERLPLTVAPARELWHTSAMRHVPLAALSWLCIACGGAGSAPNSTAPAAAPGQPEAVATTTAARTAPSPSTAPAVPAGYVPMVAAGVASIGAGGAAVVLTDEGRTVLIPIFIGGTEGTSIEHRLRSQPRQRPLTHDLIDAILGELGASLVQVQIDEIRAGVFIATVLIRSGDRVVDIDARSSDAVALAVGADLPIYVARAVIDEAGIEADDPGAEPYEIAIAGPVAPAELAARIETLADRACACPDAKCAQGVQTALLALIGGADAPPPAADQSAIATSLERMKECLEKLSP